MKRLIKIIGYYFEYPAASCGDSLKIRDMAWTEKYECDGMKAIILAAGRGTRISRQIGGKPKCTVPLNDGKTLIQYTISLLRSKGVNDFALVTGYRGEEIRELLSDMPIRYYENPFYDITNSIASLWFSREELVGTGRFIIMNGDVFLSEEAIDLILREERSPVLFYDVTRKENADYKFFCEGDRIIKYGKQLSLEETSGEYVGCASFDQSFLEEFGIRLDELISKQQHSLWWEDILYSMTKDRPVIAKDIEGAFWAEVDYIEDYQRIMNFCRTRQDILSKNPIRQ
jgi:L-glutamine-phosphate cytidylyltransferase